MITLWKRATPDFYWSVGNQFGVRISTLGAAVIQVCRAINRLLLRRVVTLGNVQDIVDGFVTDRQTAYPNLDTNHVAKDYIN